MGKAHTHNTPKLRFPEFKGEWNVRPLGDIATFSKGKGVSKSDIVEDGKTPCIRYGELYTHYGTKIEHVLSRTNAPAQDLKLSAGGEVIVPASGEDAKDIATAAAVMPSGVALGGDINVIRGDFDAAFLAEYLAGKKRLALAALAQGNSVVHLYPAQLHSLVLGIPRNFDEQQKIAAFLGAVDEKLEGLRRKRDLLTDYKRGVMQRLFAQQIRFTRDDGTAFPEWEEKRLGEIAERRTIKNQKLAITRVLTNSAVQGVVDQGDYFEKDIANADNLGGYYLIEKGDFVYNPRISVTAPVGPIKRNKVGTGVMSPLYTIFRVGIECITFFEQYFDSSFWHQYLKSIANYGARHDRMAISTSDFMDMPLPWPHPDEQQKIADFLSALDKKIDTVAEQITQTQAFKKGLLQQMFV